MARPPFWKMTIWIDVLWNGPFYVAAIYAIIRAREWIRVPALVWCGSMTAVVAIILSEEYSGVHAAPHFGFVLALNLPWLLLPLGTLIRMAREHPLAEPGPGRGQHRAACPGGYLRSLALSLARSCGARIRHASVTSSASLPGSTVGQPQHHQRQAVVAGRGEELVRLAEQQGLLLGLVADVEHRDVGPDAPRLTRQPLGVGPDETLAADAEVEAVAVDLRHVRQGKRQTAHVIGVSHRGTGPVARIRMATG